MGFRALPSGSAITLDNLTVPACLVGQAGDLTTTSITIEDGKIAEFPATTRVDMDGAFVLPAFVDMHTHLDKGHIWARSPNPDGTFIGALTTVGEDRAANWTAEDVHARMTFALKCAYAHGTRAIRTHLDSIPPQDDISWPVFDRVRAEWAGKIDLQAACLAPADKADLDGDFGHTADLVRQYNGVLGLVTYPMEGLDATLRAFFAYADAHGLDTDFHVDETMDASVETLRDIAQARLDVGYAGRTTVGHCCSLSVQDEARAMDTLDLVAKAELDVVSLPMCNLFLQDRHANRTPRNRGVTLVHEMKARGINVSFASDNTRDPFYAYGDLDMLEVMRQATRIAHLDHSDADWPLAFAANPAKAMGIADQPLAPGQPADLVICNAREWTELYSRPQSDRIVIRNGQEIDTTLPDYRELDAYVRTS
ncbi:MAG: cytosine deaminase [Pseudomonadota bacterium]